MTTQLPEIRIQQLMMVGEVIRRGMNVSNAAKHLNISQPNVSRSIALLESELGVQIFSRRGRRLLGLTEAGAEIAKIAERIVQSAHDFQRVRQQAEDRPLTLTIVGNQSLSRYVGPTIIKQYLAAHPNVCLRLTQMSAVDSIRTLAEGNVDMYVGGVPPGPKPNFPDNLALIPLQLIKRVLIARKNHPILRSKRVTLEEIARYPLVLWNNFTLQILNREFARKNLKPHIVMIGTDETTIKKYVAEGIGISFIPSILFDKKIDTELGAIEVQHCFGWTPSISVGFRKNCYIADHVYEFARMISPRLTRAAIDEAVYGKAR